MFCGECTGLVGYLSKLKKMSTKNSCNHHDQLDVELNNKLRELSLIKSPSKTRKTVTYLGDDDDHFMREGVRSAISPSPKADERHRAEQKNEALADLTESYRTILRDIGEDPTRQGLLRTPERAAKALLYFTKGYDEKIAGTYLFLLFL